MMDEWIQAFMSSSTNVTFLAVFGLGSEILKKNLLYLLLYSGALASF